MITHDLRVMADAMLDKKAQNVIDIDLRPLGTAITDHFMICNADSTTNVNAIADNVNQNDARGRPEADPYPGYGEQLLDHTGLR